MIAKPPQTRYRVIVRDSIIRFFEKEFNAISVEEAILMAEEDCWTPEDGWKELPKEEAITECVVEYVDKVE